MIAQSYTTEQILQLHPELTEMFNQGESNDA